MLFDGEYQGLEMEVFTDDSTDCKSSQGYMIILYGTSIVWKVSKQFTVITFFTEAEFLAFTEVSKEAIAIIRLFAGIRFYLYEDIVIWCDNQQTIRFVTADIPV